jgi:amino acid transporter
MMCSLCIYVLVFVCFIILRVKHKKMARYFHSPLGIPSAIFGMAFFSTAIVTFFMYTPFVT